MPKSFSIDTEHFSALFENATEGIILTNGRGPIVLANPAAERIFGYEPGQMIGKTIEMLIPTRFRKQHEGLREGFFHKPQNRVMGHGRDLFGLRKDGSEFPVEVSLSYYSKNEELFVIAFIVDITERKKIEASILKQQAELERMTEEMRGLNSMLEQKVEERTIVLTEALAKLEESRKELNEAYQKEKQLSEIKSRFVSIASHEFRTPLSTVLSSASLLAKYSTTEDQPKRERHVEKIKNAVRNLNDILEDFLSLGKLDEGKVDMHPVEFNLHECISAVSEETSSLLKPGQQISIVHDGPPLVCTDKKLLKNVIVNLVTNSIKFSDPGKSIKIKSRISESEASVEIIDEGIGIPEDELEHLYSSFHRARNAINIQGTGLGLHIVKRYLDLLNGNIRVSSTLGKGTSFCIQIPLSKEG